MKEAPGREWAPMEPDCVRERDDKPTELCGPDHNTRSGGAIEVADNSKPAQRNQGEVTERQTPTGNRVAPHEIKDQTSKRWPNKATCVPAHAMQAHSCSSVVLFGCT